MKPLELNDFVSGVTIEGGTIEWFDQPDRLDCAACGHRHRGTYTAGGGRNMDRCGWADGWDGGAPTEFCDCKDLVPEYEQED